MNKILSYVALGLSIIALLVASSIGLSNGTLSFGVASEGASCSGTSACTAFPGILRVDQVQIGGATAGANQTVVNTAGTIVAPLSGSATSALSVSTTTALAANFDCVNDLITIPTSTAGITLTLPAATSTAATCLVVDGAQEETIVQLQIGNNFNVTIATSTGDIVSWNGTSTAGGLTLATSSAGSYFLINSIRLTSSSILYTIGNLGIGH